MQYIIKIKILKATFFNVAARKFGITFASPILFLLDSAAQPHSEMGPRLLSGHGGFPQPRVSLSGG